MIDFIGQEGPTSKWKLASLDVCILILQLVMVSVHVKRRELKKKLVNISSGVTATNTADQAAPGQDADDEERGLLHRTDTLSDIGLDPDEEHALSSSSPSSPSSGPGQPDALDILTSGQCAIGDFSLIDTLLQENKNYSAYRLTRSETLQRLNTLRTRFAVGGG
ncbi:hypothetical protein GQ44DRAFT_705143 [Phaeosphaeriaceae sp. PMI808]|nr:hypothetical protein GQ44DRAFT_705143 [Phaeosphaeriaceae sp. PMI808]